MPRPCHAHGLTRTGGRASRTIPGNDRGPSRKASETGPDLRLLRVGWMRRAVGSAGHLSGTPCGPQVVPRLSPQNPVTEPRPRRAHARPTSPLHRPLAHPYGGRDHSSFGADQPAPCTYLHPHERPEPAGRRAGTRVCSSIRHLRASSRGATNHPVPTVVTSDAASASPDVSSDPGSVGMPTPLWSAPAEHHAGGGSPSPRVADNCDRHRSRQLAPDRAPRGCRRSGSRFAEPIRPHTGSSPLLTLRSRFAHRPLVPRAGPHVNCPRRTGTASGSTGAPPRCANSRRASPPARPAAG